VDKTVSVTRNATGTVRRLSAAVVLNHVEATDRKGQSSSTPLPPEQMEQINALVREAIGFSTTRGDSVNVMNAAFTKPAVDTTDVAWWKQPDTFDLARSLAWPVGMLMLGLLLFLGMVRPALKMMAAPPPLPNRSGATNANGSLVAGTQLDTLLDEQPQRPSLPAPVQNEPTAEMLRLEDAKRLARENPVAVANIVKGWVNGESPSAA
jgi:flagellar M-ring protein FliF